MPAARTGLKYCSPELPVHQKCVRAASENLAIHSILGV